MGTWEEYVRQKLSLPDLDAERERRIVRELAGQLEDIYQEALSRGLSAREADRHTRRQIPDWRLLADDIRRIEGRRGAPRVEIWLERVAETNRSKRGWNMVGDFVRDLHYALRQCRKNIGFTVLAASTLAIGIGANSAVYSILHAVLISPLPFAGSQRIMVLSENNRPRHNPFNLVSPANYHDWRTRSRSFQSMAAFYYTSKVLTGFDFPEWVQGVAVTGEFFDALGVSPQVGSIPSLGEIRKGEPTVVVSDAFWHRRFGGDPEAIGKTLTLSDQIYVVAGVLPPLANYPPFAELWFPTAFTEEEETARGRYCTVVGRLKDGVVLEQARGEMTGIAQALEKEHPRYNTDFGVTVVPLRDALAGKSRSAILLLFATVGLVLLIACSNVANLQLGRLIERRRELALRHVLGGPRSRLLRQLLTESLALGGLGGVAGLGLAAVGTALLPAMLPGSVRLAFPVHLSLPVFFFALAISVGATLLFGTFPALRFSKTELRVSLSEGARTGLSRNSQRLRAGLVVGELAVTLVLLIGAGLLVRSIVELTRVNPGFEPKNLLTAKIALPDGIGGQDSPKAPDQAAFFESVLERAGAIPGVESVGAVSFLPIDSWAAGTGFVLRDRPEPAPGQEPVADVVVVAGDYFQTMRIPLVRGRFFGPQERAGGPPGVIVNEALVREHWPNEDPIGKPITMAWDRPVDGRVVGVVGDVLQKSLSAQPRPTLYWPESQFTFGFMTLVARSGREPSELTREVRETVASLKPDLPLTFKSYEAVLSDSLAEERTTIQILSAFALTAIVLAVVGLYGVISHWVRQRTHEIGIRVALGAQRRGIYHLVLARGAAIALLGLTIGAAASLGLTRVLQGSLFGVTPTDPATFAGAALLLVGVALLACYLPARRATRVDPMSALRCD